MGRLSRRQFVLGAGAAVAGLLAGCGRLPGQTEQAPARVYRVGYLTSTARSSRTEQWDEAFLEALRERGYLEGQNLLLERRSWEPEPGGVPSLVTEQVQLPVDVLVVARDVRMLQAASEAAASIPIVAIALGDPVGEGWVQSLAQPGGNITGVSTLAPQLSGKRLELLKEAIPAISRVGMFWNPDASTNQATWQETEVAAPALGVRLQSLPVRNADEFERVAELAVREQPDALLLPTGGLVNGTLRTRISDFATQQRLPTMYASAEVMRDVNGLMAYGASFVDMHRRAAYFVDRILKGAKPADLPVEQPMTFDFVVNMKTAQALGITFPNEIMLQVTEVLQ